MNKDMASCTPPTIINEQAIPDKQCPDCGRTCIVKKSNSLKNPGKLYYKCPENFGLNSNFFQWCKETKRDHGENFLRSPKATLTSCDTKQDSPECSCGAGICDLVTEFTGKDKGRKKFICPVKKGQGACNFVQWEDGVDEDDVNGIGSTEKGLKKMSLREGVVDLGLPRIGDLKVSEMKTSVGVVGNPGICYRCSKEGHWAKDCLNRVNSVCYKCAKVGHWAKDCPS